MSNFFSRMLRPKKVSTMDKMQQGLYNQMAQALQGGGGPLGDIYSFDPEAAQNFWQQSLVNPAMQNFNEQVVPGITGAFRGNNLQNSSYLGGGLAKSGTDLQSSLNAQLAQMLYQGQQDAINRKQGGLNQLLNMQTQAYQTSPIMQLLSALASSAGQAAGSMAMGG